MTWRYFALVGIAVFFGALAALSVRDLPAVTAVATTLIACVSGIAYGQRAVLPSVRAAAVSGPARFSTPWIPVIVLTGMLLLPAILPVAGVVGSIAITFALTTLGVSLAYAALRLRVD